MRLHDRYLFRELLTPLAICLGGFVVFWISIFFVTEQSTIQERKLSLGEAAAYCAANLPGVFVFLLPILLLLALLYALTQHARHNEVTALRAAGLSLWRLCAPYFAVGLLATGAYFALDELAVPRCNRWAEKILNRHVKPAAAPRGQAPLSEHTFENNRAHRSWIFFGDYNFADNTMPNPTVTWTRPDGSLEVLKAARAARTNGVWTFFDAHLSELSGPGTEMVSAGSTNVLARPEFDETPGQIRLLLKFKEKQQLRSADLANVSLTELWQLRHDPALRPEDRRALQTTLYSRLAMPWTCFVVVLVAIPFGTPAGRRNLFFGVAGSLFIVFVYFILQRVSFALGMNGQLPPWLAAGLPNLIFAVTGIALTLRVR